MSSQSTCLWAPADLERAAPEMYKALVLILENPILGTDARSIQSRLEIEKKAYQLGFKALAKARGKEAANV